ncbi:MAG: hypothetical protein E7589_00760 [Ruminococcaceae bacterium]|nr:hypothetical protein [Oscillospiraceae bacterium]
MKNNEINLKPAVVRVRLADALNAFFMLMVAVGLVFVLLVMEWQNWSAGVVGSILSTILAVVACLCVFDVAVLLTACMTVSEGAINAGKNKYGEVMLFHIEEIAEINLCDKHGQPVTAGKRAYRNADLNFVMKSGRVNTRHFERITSKQLESIKKACGF